MESIKQLLRAKLERYLPSGGFGRAVAVVSGGTAAAQLINIAASPVLTRLYTPDDFGILAVYIAALAILLVMTTWQWEFAIPLADDDADAASVLVVCVLAVFVMAGIYFVLTGFFGETIAGLAGLEKLAPYLWVLPAGLVVVGLYQSFSYWAIRKKAFGQLARTKLSQSLGQVSSQVIMGFLGVGPVGLLVGDVVGKSAGVGTLATAFWRRDRGSLPDFGDGGRENLAKVMRRYKKFPLVSSWAQLLNAAGMQVPIVLFATFYGTEVAGWIMLAQRVIGVPMALVGQAVSQVFFGEGSELVRTEPRRFHQLFRRSARKLFLLGVVPIAGVALIGPWIFGLVFGDAWVSAGDYVRALSWMFVLQFVAAPLSQTLYVVERQDLALIWNGFRFLITVLSVWGAHSMNWSSFDAVLLYGSSMSLAYLLILLMCDFSISKYVTGNTSAGQKGGQ